MKRLTLMTSIAGLAMIAGPALADPPAGRGGGNAGATMGAGTNGGMNGGMSATGQTMRDQARINSQGPANASATGIAHANENSVLSGTTTDTAVRGQGAANASVNGLGHAGTGSALGGAGSMDLNIATQDAHRVPGDGIIESIHQTVVEHHHAKRESHGKHDDDRAAAMPPDVAPC